MKLFKRSPWITIWRHYGRAQMNRFGRTFEADVKTVVQVKERKNGTYRIRAFANSINGQTIQDFDWEYVTHTIGDKKLEQALSDYNIKK